MSEVSIIATHTKSRWHARLVTRMAKRRGRWIRAIVVSVLAVVMGLYALCAACVLALRWINPPTTMVQMERRLDAIRRHRTYKKRYEFVSLRRISPGLQHAV